MPSLLKVFRFVLGRAVDWFAISFERWPRPPYWQGLELNFRVSNHLGHKTEILLARVNYKLDSPRIW